MYSATVIRANEQNGNDRREPVLRAGPAGSAKRQRAASGTAGRRQRAAAQGRDAVQRVLPEGEEQPGRALRGVPSDGEQPVVRRTADSAPPHKDGTQCNACYQKGRSSQGVPCGECQATKSSRWCGGPPTARRRTRAGHSAARATQSFCFHSGVKVFHSVFFKI